MTSARTMASVAPERTSIASVTPRNDRAPVTSIFQRDYPVVQAVVLVLAGVARVGLSFALGL